ncbi:MAG: GNAT family N-acetyltransferase [Promethearchaeota archaeon]
MVNIIYRHYKEGDEMKLADLFNLAFQQAGGMVRTPKNWYWRFVKSPGFEPYMCQIAEDVDKKKIVGAIQVNLVEMIPIGQEKYLVGEINDVATLPDYTKSGIATKLMKLSTEYMEQKGCDFSILSTGFKGFARTKLYQKFGYYDIERGLFFIQFPNLFQLIRNVCAFAILFPVFFTISYISRFLNRVRIKFNPFFKDFSYEIVHNKKHFEYMSAINKIMPKYYEGYPEYDKSKFLWARIKVPANRQKPTYIIIRKSGKTVGGSVITHQNIYAFKYGIKIKLGIIHEIFLDKSIFNNYKDLYLGYIYLIDKTIKAATRRSLGILIYNSTMKDVDLNQAFKGMNFLKIKGNVVMIKELKTNVSFPHITKPFFNPTYISFGVP